MGKKLTFWNKFWKDKHGKQGIIQPASATLIGWAVLTLIAKLIPGGDAETLIEFLAFGCLIIWASLEVVSGISYFRRTLGFIVLFCAIYVRVAAD